MQKIIFKDKDSSTFYSEVKKRVNQYFVDNNLSTHADWRMVLKTVILLSVYIGSYLVILFAGLPVWAMWILCLVLGVATAGIGFSVAHDAIHGAYSSNDKVNYAIGLSMNLIGGNRYMWSITHNIVHHTYTNIHHHDEDLELAPFIRLSKHAPYKKIHRYQQYFAFVAYSMACFFWVTIKDFKKFLQKEIGNYDNKNHPRKEAIILISTKLFYYTYIFALPLLILHLSWWQFLIGYATMYVTAGLILGIIFQLAHVVEGAEQPLNDANGVIYDSWAVHQMRTTSNFAMNSSIVNWYVGGLNFQVEHHLFPRVCSVHYPVIYKIVKATSEEFGVPYNYHPTLLKAMKSHYRTLKLFGQAEVVEELHGNLQVSNV